MPGIRTNTGYKHFKKKTKPLYRISKSKKNPKGNKRKNKEVAGRGREIRTPTAGFGDRCSTIETMPLQNGAHYTWKISKEKE